MSITDRKLETKLRKQMSKLERSIDAIAPTPLRHEMSEYLTNMRITLTKFDQRKYDDELFADIGQP